MTADDLVINELADSEATAWERVADLECENRVLRDIVREALSQLARQTAHLSTARRKIRSLEYCARPAQRVIRTAA